jgi:hypothetical protein
MVFVAIYKKPREGVRPDVAVFFKHKLTRLTLIDNRVVKVENGMVSTPFLIDVIIDDGIDESVCHPEIPPKDMLYLESEMPKWLSKYSSIHEYDPAKAEERLMENGFTIVTDEEEQKTLYNYFVETAHKNVAIAGCEKAKAIKCGVIERFQNEIDFLPLEEEK